MKPDAIADDLDVLTISKTTQPQCILYHNSTSKIQVSSHGMLMKLTPRLFYCLRCHAQTIVCSPCDRGQIYCGSACAYAARIQSCRSAEKRYQLTLNGKMKHAMRQRHYRARLTKKVTDQGSNPPMDNGLLQEVKNKAKKEDISLTDVNRRCFFCRKKVSSWFRSEFLRHYVSSLPRNMSNFQPINKFTNIGMKT